MTVSFSGIRISISLVALCAVFFFFNRRPKFVLPSMRLRQHYRWLYRILSLLVIFSVILLPLRIAFVSDNEVVTEKNIPVQIILDVSLSMAATDLQPSRFVAAKASLISLVRSLDGYYISLITFSGKPFVYIPFSSDSKAIAAKLETMNLGDFPPVQEFLGTAIGDALLLGVNNLNMFADRNSYKPGVVILITDGDSNIGFDPMQVVRYYQKMHIPIFVLGVGDSTYLIGRDKWNDKVTTTIDLDLLQQLAEKTGGKFYRVLGEQSFDSFLSEFVQTMVSHQYQKIQHIFWELNDYLFYVLITALFGLLVLRVYLLVSQQQNTIKKFEN